MGFLLRWLKPYAPAAALTLVLVAAQAVAELGLPTLMAWMVDQGVVHHDLGVLAWGGAAMVGAALAGALASVGGSWLSARLGAGFGRDLRGAVFRRITAMTVEEVSNLGTASLITRSTNDVTQVQSFVVLCLRMLAMAPLMALGGLVLAFLLDPGLALVLAVAVPALGLAMTLLAGRAVTLFRLVQQKIDRLNLVLRESLTGVRVIRAFDRQEFDADRFRGANLDLAQVSLQTQKLMAVVMPGMMFVMSATTVALVWFGAGRIATGTLHVGGLLAFIQYATQILFSLMMMSMLFVLLPRASVSAGRLHDVLSGVPDPDAGEAPARTEGTPGARIEFRHVTFRYSQAEQPTLDDVSFVIPAGSTTALIGGTGSGKTTILNLILRFHDATSGQVLVDGVDVTQWPRGALRRRFGLSAQKARLFTGTVAENLRWGDPDAPEATLREALATAQADFVDALPGGLEAPIDKGGANLSGGQKQRLSIARALVRRPGGLLFDDSFSALDAKTDAALRAALGRRPGGATVVLVAQRVATVRNADQIIVLDQGRVAGTGTHRGLIDGCPVYREIVASQEGREVTP